jgi:hypothetical protein
MRTKTTVRDLVTKTIKNYGALKPKDLIEKVNRPANQVYTTVSKMKQENVLSKTSTGHIVLSNAPALTALKPNVPITIDSTSKISTRKATGMEMHLGSKVSKLEAEIKNLELRLQDTTIKYFDAMAVVRYLESKLNVSKK